MNTTKTRCKIEESMTEELLKITTVGLSFAKDTIKEEHMKTCEHVLCQEMYKMREKLGLNNQVFADYAKGFDFDEEDEQ